VGKTVVTRDLVRRYPDQIVFSVSATTRERRAGEVEGRDYIYLTKDEFLRRVEAGEFLEYTGRIGKYYGTLRAPLEEHLREGRDVILDVDVRGGEAMRKHYPYGLFIYLLPPSQDLLVQRLRGRGRDPEEEIEARLELGLAEAKYLLQYDYLTVNWEIEETVDNVWTIIRADRFRRERSLKILIRLGCVPKEMEEYVR
jgi:guanylate kinase